MSEREQRPEQRPAYQPPSVTRVHVDPIKELLQATTCSFNAGSGVPACEASPGV